MAQELGLECRRVPGVSYACDCENPDAEGVRHVSMECPVHNVLSVCRCGQFTEVECRRSPTKLEGCLEPAVPCL